MAIKKFEHVNILTLDMPATLHFYCDILGLVNKKNPDRIHNAFLAIDSESEPVLHVIDVNFPPTSKLKRFGAPSPVNNSEFRTGPIDHLGLIFDLASYEKVLNLLIKERLEFQLIEQPRKQMRVLDPNGVCIELIFNDD